MSSKSKTEAEVKSKDWQPKDWQKQVNQIMKAYNVLQNICHIYVPFSVTASNVSYDSGFIAHI